MSNIVYPPPEKLLNNIHLYIRRAMTDTMPLHWKMLPRTIFDHELIFVQAGKVKLTLDGKQYAGNENDVLLIPPGKIHSIETYGAVRWTQPHVHFDFVYDEKQPEPYIPFEIIRPDSPDYKMIRENYYEKLELPPLLKFQNFYTPQKIKDLLFKIIDLQSSHNPCDLLYAKNHLTEILILLLEETHPTWEVYQDKYQRIYALTNLLIEKQLTYFFNIQEIADALNYTPNYISTIYKNHFGITPAKKYEQMKMMKAKGYVAQKNISITEIANILGYISINDFSRAFKRYFGVSPTQFRKNLP